MNLTAAPYRLLTIALLLAGAWLAGLPPQPASQKKPAAAQRSVFSAEKARFKILADGQPIAAEEFELAPAGGSWLAKGSVVIRAAGAAPVRVSASLKLRPDGTPETYDWTAQSDKKNGAHIVFENGTANISLEVQGAKPFSQVLTFASPKVVILDNNLYHHYAILARVYNWSAGGAQTFPVLIPQDLTPGNITVESTGPQTLEGKSYAGLRVTTADLEVILYLDANHRLQRLEVPTAKVSVARE